MEQSDLSGVFKRHIFGRGVFMKHVELDDVATSGLQEVLNVRDFAKRYRLADTEEERLLSLFGAFATRAELLSNARRSSVFR